MRQNCQIAEKQVRMQCLFFKKLSEEENHNSWNPDTSKYPLMSNRIYCPLYSEYRAYFNVLLVLKITISERLFFYVYSNVYFVRLQENDKFMVTNYLQPNSF